MADQDIPEIPVVTSVGEAPVIFADVMYHMTWLNGVARLTFVQNNADVPVTGIADFVGRHVVTIAMPFGNVVAMRDYITKTISEWEEATRQGGQS